MEFPDRLTEIRKQRGFTQQSIADALGVERTRYTKWESGRSYPSIEMLISICDLLDISADFLMGRITEQKAFKIKTPPELEDVEVESVTKMNSEPLTPDELAAIRKMLGKS